MNDSVNPISSINYIEAINNKLFLNINQMIEDSVRLTRNGLRFGGTVTLPSGHYYLSEPVRLHRLFGIKIVGQGMQTILTYVGDPSLPVFDLRDVRSPRIESFCIKAQLDYVNGLPGALAAFCLSRHQTPDNNYNSSAAIIHDIEFGSGNGLPDFKYGIMISNQQWGGPDGNNENNTFSHLQISGCSEANFYIEAGSSQATHNTKISRCGFTGGKYGFHTKSTVNNVTLDFGGGYHTEADIFLEEVGGAGIRIHDCNSENSKRFLVTGGPTGATLKTRIENCRFETNIVDHPDDYCIDFRSPGPLSMDFLDLSMNNRNPRIRVHTANPGSLSFTNANVRFNNPLPEDWKAKDLFFDSNGNWKKWIMNGKINVYHNNDMITTVDADDLSDY